MSQYTISDSSNCLNTTNSHNTTNNVWNNCTVADDLAPLLEWLSPLDPGLRHCDIQERRVANVGEWLMETEKFKRWCGLSGEDEGQEAVLFCYGNPGVGKTFISSLVVDRLCNQTREKHTAVTCFYFDFAAQKEQTATSMLGSLLKQVISGMERVPEGISQGLQEQKKAVSGRKPQLDDIVKALQLITSSQRTFMVIDALDECTAVQRFRLFDSLGEILDRSPGARVFVTGRSHICPEIETRLAGRAASISLGPAKDDIIRFLRVRLNEDETPDAMDPNLEAEILEKIPGSASEMFLLASLSIEGILQEPTRHRRRERLRNMTDGLGLEGVYGATIERIRAQGGYKCRLGMGALMWISYAERPLSAKELCHALAIELGSADFNADNIPSISTVVGRCQGLITVDKEASTVRLIHFTLREYFSGHPDIFSRPHSVMAEICLTYLNSKRVRDLPWDLFDNPSGGLYDAYPWDVPAPTDGEPFLNYCSLHWGAHAKRELSDCATLLALELLRGEYDRHISRKLLLKSLRYKIRDVGSPFSGLHCASYFGIVEVVSALIEKKDYDVNGRDLHGLTPLSLAVSNRQEEVVKMLLGREEVNPNEPDNDGRTPLSYAAGAGCEDVVKMLLGREEVRPDRPDNVGRTPLSHAAKVGCEGVVKILLGREEVEPDKSDNRGGTPLSNAAFEGHGGVVKALLGRKEVDPNSPNFAGETPLIAAAIAGHAGVVKMLLEREDINPDKSSNLGRTPLSYAASWGREEVVKTLLEREEVEPDKPGNDGRTPLSYATGRGSEGGGKNATPAERR